MRHEKKRLKQLLSRRGLAYSLALCLLILGLGGLGFWLIEPDVHTLSDSLWLAFTTAATVGYGDLVPTTMLSRGFAVMVVLLGLAVLSMVTASVAAMLVETDEQKVQHELLHELAALRAEVQALHADVRTLREGRKPPA